MSDFPEFESSVLKELLYRNDFCSVAEKIYLKSVFTLLLLPRGNLLSNTETLSIDKCRAFSKLISLIGDAYCNQNSLLFLQINFLLDNFSWRTVYNIDSELYLYKEIAMKMVSEITR